MPVHDELGLRMKGYESVPKISLERKKPVIIRIDGKAFHTFTRGFQKPFDDILVQTMQETTQYLCENIQGCVLGYTQSDEITLVLVDYKNPNSDAWFDYEVQKMCSISASMATMAFNKIFLDNIDIAYDTEFHSTGIDNEENFSNKEEYDKAFYTLARKYDIYYRKVNKAMFDARVFNLEKDEVANCIYWRQLDAMRNSVQMLGQAHYSQKQLQGKTCNDIKRMLIEQKGIDWENLPICKKWGSFVIKVPKIIKSSNTKVIRNKWVIGTTAPLIKGNGRDYVEKLIMVGE